MADPSSATFGGLKDFSVESQRKMFQDAQERERREAAAKKASREIRKQSDKAAGSGAVALSGMMAALEEEGGGEAGGAAGKRRAAGDDDDDSLGDDAYSVGSEESFYVGIERADYAQPDSLEMYGEGKDDDDGGAREDRLGISRISVAVIHREVRSGAGVPPDWDADLPVVGEDRKRSSLHEFMNGSGGGGSKAPLRAVGGAAAAVVARPVVGSGLAWAEEGKLREDDGNVDQVYEHKAAEGKAFIDKLAGDASSSAEATAGDAAAPGSAAGGREGTYPKLSPLMLFTPGLSAPGSAAVGGEDNAARQMREREVRREADARGNEKLAELRDLVASSKDGKVDAAELMKRLETMMGQTST